MPLRQPDNQRPDRTGRSNAVCSRQGGVCDCGERSCALAKSSVDDRLGNDLKVVRRAETALENAVCQDDVYEAWEEALWAAGELEERAEQLRKRITAELNRQEVELEEAEELA